MALRAGVIDRDNSILLSWFSVGAAMFDITMFWTVTNFFGGVGHICVWKKQRPAMLGATLPAYLLYCGYETQPPGGNYYDDNTLQQ